LVEYLRTWRLISFFLHCATNIFVSNDYMILGYQNNSFCWKHNKKQTNAISNSRTEKLHSLVLSISSYSAVSILCEQYTQLCQTQSKIKEKVTLIQIKNLLLRFFLLHFLLKGNKKSSRNGWIQTQ